MFCPCPVRQGAGDRINDRGNDIGEASEAHLALCGVDIDIDEGRFDIQVQEKAGMQAGGEPAETIADGAQDIFILDGASIEEDVLKSLVAARFVQRENVACYADAVCMNGAEAKELFCELLPEELGDAVAQVRRGGDIEDDAAFLHEGEAHVREGEGMEAHLVFGVGCLGFGAFEELSACRGVVEELAHLDMRAGRASCRAEFFLLPTVEDDAGAFDIPGAPGGDGHVRHGGDAGDSFPAEPHAASLVEILKFFDFAGGVIFCAEGEVGAAHAVAVVVHLDEGAAAADDFDAHGAGAGVDAVFDEFLDDGGRSLDHFPGSHATRQRVIHQVNGRLFSGGFWRGGGHNFFKTVAVLGSR